MEEKLMLSNVLTLTKNLCDVLMHGTIESQVNHTIIKDVLNDFLGLQNEIYNVMVQQGWYNNVPVDSSKIQQLKNKFSQ